MKQLTLQNLILLITISLFTITCKDTDDSPKGNKPKAEENEGGGDNNKIKVKIEKQEIEIDDKYDHIFKEMADYTSATGADIYKIDPRFLYESKQYIEIYSPSGGTINKKKNADNLADMLEEVIDKATDVSAAKSQIKTYLGKDENGSVPKGSKVSVYKNIKDAYNTSSVEYEKYFKLLKKIKT